MNDTKNSPDIEQRVRHALHAVAETVTEDAFASVHQPSATRKTSRRRRIGLGIGALAIPVAMAASMFVHEGSEYAAPIPQDRIVMRGSVGGSPYVLAETDRTDKCGHPIPGVELVEERKNLVGSEWNTSGYSYGEETGAGCDYIDTTRWLKNPALFSDSGVEVGDSFVFVYAVHPAVTAVRITAPGGYTKDLKVYEVDGAGYAPFEIPRHMETYTSKLLIGGHLVPGSKTTRTVPRP